MDRIKKARKPERAAVTRIITTLEGELEKDEVNGIELEASIQSLNRHLEKLSELDEQIKEVLLDDAGVTEVQYQQECDVIEDYQNKATLIKVKVNSVLNPKQASEYISLGRSQVSPSASTRTSHVKNTIKLPKIELKKFSGELTEWLGWWAQFEKIHEDEDLHESDKFTYLVQCMTAGSRAYDLVSSYPHTKENYPKVVSALKERYGNAKLLKQVYVRELIQMIILNRSKEKTPLVTLFDKLESQLRSLESLGVSMEQMVVFLFPLVESSLPEEILLAWQRSPCYGKNGTQDNPPKSELDFLMAFLKQEIDNEEQRKLAMHGFGSSSEQKKSIKKKKEFSDEEYPTAAGLFSGSQLKLSCLFCEKPHESKDCFKAQKMSLAEKKEKVQKSRACFSCLRSGHISSKCKAHVKCPVCSKKHLVLFCPDIPANQSSDVNQGKQHETKTIQSSLNCTNEVLLRTLRVKLVNAKNGRQKTVRILLDCGSQRSYVLRKTAKELGLVTVKNLTVNHTLFGGSEVLNQSHSILDLLVRSMDDKIIFPMRVLDQERICGLVPRLSGQWMTELEKRGVKLLDTDPRNPLEVEMLIGADYLGQLLTGKVIQLDNGLTATETLLGWTVMGQLKCQESKSNLAMMSISNHVASASVAELWRLDTLGIRDPVEVKTQVEREQAARNHFVETVKRLPDGRYSVSLPWMYGETEIPNNRKIAMKRLESTTKKLCFNSKYKDYDDVFKSWEAEGIISRHESSIEDKNRKCHFLPHRAVFNPESRTTPVRPVFDASCKQGRSPSLNDCLEKGPNLLEVIPSLLLRFRLGKIGVIADIRKAFLMIEVNEEDRDFLQFLWWESHPGKSIVTYRHNRVVFGMNCSPFLLAAVINHHLNSFLQQDRVKVEKLGNSLYVDNCVLSLSTLAEYEHFKSFATDVMANAQMELRQWEHSGEEGETPVTGVLGLKWDKVRDTLACVPMASFESTTVTKRMILSQLHQVFDPLGFLSPVMLIPKMLLQKAWKENRQWDEEVNAEMKTEFLKWREEMLELLKWFRVPRKCTGEETPRKENSQFHVFSDASKHAYAVVVFLRMETKEGVTVQLLQSNARVAPVKQITIPRLELLGCCIAARLLSSVKAALNLEEVPIYFWSDSSTALSWIKRNDEWGTFVGNRVREILTLTTVDQWKYVPGLLNPADLPSRGISPFKFGKLKWWEGPGWLKDQENWPGEDCQVDEEAVNRERKKRICSLSVKSQSHPWYIVRNSYHVNLRIMAFVFRFVDKLKKRSKEKSDRPTVIEINRAEILLFKLTQEESFEKMDKVISGLKVHMGNDGLLRVKTKLTNRQDSPSFKSPVLLPNSHPLVDMIIREEHVYNCHGGAQFLMGALREKCWIIQGRKAVKKVLRSCTTCQRFTAKKVEVPVAALPEDRVKDVGAFEVTGIDLTGPLLLKNKSKVWIILFTCGVYRCLHLEMVQSLSTEDFLLAFVRFCKRKRRPVTVYSDNGTNFGGANTLFRSINWKEVMNRTQQQRVHWKFIPPTAPWWGGWWERLFRNIKDLLRKMLGFGKLNYAELETCLCEVEAVVNHRPLNFVTEDTDDLVPLTPALFIYNLPESAVPEAKVVKVDSLESKKKNLDHLLEELRGRFRSEYLGQLVQRGKEKKQSTLKVGDFVFVGRDDKKRMFWPMARITELIPGKDGVCRVAKVRTKTGVLVRPLQRLYPLEVSHDDVLFPVLEEKRKDPQLEKKAPEVMKTRSGRTSQKPNRYWDNWQS